MQTSIRYSIAVYLGLLLAGAVVRPQVSAGLTSAPVHPTADRGVLSWVDGSASPEGAGTFVVTPPDEADGPRGPAAGQTDG